MSTVNNTDELDAATRQALDADAFRALLAHLRERSDVQNIDLMNLAGFCRNCLSRHYREAAEARGIDLSVEAARERVYGMPYSDWKARYQTEATPDQKAALAAAQDEHG
ncbi:MAG: alkaline phosphatase [Gammaproteobacteria bacterium]|nr:MAG: alkaline phosphatase [Gammaproteobacteria bacterium]PIE34557.1 MAG: alkaline phosphatase [Gammaproteobacteria bacterium]